MNFKRAMAMGFFDGVHRGHAALMNKTKERAEEIGAVPSVLTFDTHPDTLVFGKEVPLINSAAGREELISNQYGINNILFMHFDKKVMSTPWEEFIESLINDLNIAWIVVGHDFCFGYKGLGTAVKLKEYCENRGIGCDIIAPVIQDDIIISSTYIRQLISEGRIREANEYLGHKHFLVDRVHTGFHNGTKMGIPTINMFFPEGVLIPKHGVYAAQVTLDGKLYKAVTNIGIRPTFGNGEKVSVESFLLNCSGDLYGKEARIEFLDFIRPERKFESPDELAAQIRSDIKSVEDYFEKNEH